MISEFEDKISSLLGNPEELSKLTSMAKSLMEGGLFPAWSDTELEAKQQDEGESDPMLQRIFSGLMGQPAEVSSASKLSAIAPLLDDEHGKKLKRAIKMAKMAKLAKTVMRDYGGGDE